MFLDPVKVTILTPGMDEQGVMSEEGIPAALVAKFLDERGVVVERERKSVGVERTLAEDIHSWEACLEIIDFLYAELERRLTQVRPDRQIARQGVKLKFNDFQLTTQEHIWPELNKEDLIAVARKTWDERRAGRGVRLVGLHVTLLDPQLERQLLLGL